MQSCSVNLIIVDYAKFSGILEAPIPLHIAYPKSRSLGSRVYQACERLSILSKQSLDSTSPLLWNGEDIDKIQSYIQRSFNQASTSTQLNKTA